MTTPLLFRRYQQVLEISANGQGLGPLERQLITEQLTYKAKKFNFGAAAWDRVTGDRHPVSIEVRRLYQVDDMGRLACGIGFLDRLYTLLAGRGYPIQYLDQTEPSPRPDAYYFDLQRVLAAGVEFRHRQDEVATLISQRERGIIKAVAGFGKSYCVATIALAFPYAKIAVAVPGAEIMRDMMGKLTKYLPHVGQFGCGKHKRGTRINLYSFGSLHHCDEPPDILIADEVHRIAAESYSRNLASITTHARMFGFSATPSGRSDGADIRAESFFGPIIFELDWDEARANNLVPDLEVHWHPVTMAVNPSAGKQGVAKKRAGIWRNHARNAAIAAVARVYPPEESVLIMVETIDHAVYLQQHLPEYTLCYANIDKKRYEQYQNRELLGADFTPLTEQDREQMQHDFREGRLRKVISTSVWGTGVSFDHLRVVIRADGAAGNSIKDEQLPGRATRIHANKQVARLHDFVDLFDDTFENNSKRRRANYKKKGWIQIDHGNVGIRG